MNAFGWAEPATEDEVVACLREHGRSAQPIAGGGDLLGLWKDGVRGPAGPAPQMLVDLSGVPSLSGIERVGTAWRLGAMTTLVALARAAGLPPMLADAVSHIASPQLRERTTLGGNLLQRPRCGYFRHPDEPCFKKGGRRCPAPGGPPQAWPGSLLPHGPCHAGHPSDLAPVLIALGAWAQVLGPHGRRCVPLADLFEGAAARREREAAMQADDLLCRIEVPAAPCAQAVEKLAPRDANEFATASAAVAGRARGGMLTELRVAMAGVAPGPLVIDVSACVGRPLQSIDAELVANDAWPHVPGHRLAWRRTMAREALRRALSRVLAELRTAAA